MVSGKATTGIYEETQRREPTHSLSNLEQKQNSAPHRQ